MRELALVVGLAILDLVVVLLGIIYRRMLACLLPDGKVRFMLTKSKHLGGILSVIGQLNGLLSKVDEL